jgi:hypothetical protein
MNLSKLESMAGSGQPKKMGRTIAFFADAIRLDYSGYFSLMAIS